METKQLDRVESCSHLNPKPSSSSPSSSTSSASSTSDDDDFIQLDPIELEKSISRQNTPHGLTVGEGVLVQEQLQRPSKSSTDGDDIGRLSTVDLPISIAAGNPFMAADSPYAVTSSPPVQVMVKSDVPDPYRIPSSVFARTTAPVAPMDWSVASNESLFSIQGGNYSFSRDHVLLMGKAGEDTAFPGPYDPFPPPPMSAPKRLLEKEAAAGFSGDVAIKKTLSKSDYGDSDLGIQESSSPALKSSSTARRSDGSGASVHSFVFPM